MASYGYARAPSASQSTSLQEERLKQAGCEIVRTETGAGRSREGRAELDNLITFLRAGDTLSVAKLDRLGRSTRDVLNLVKELDDKGASLRVLEPDIDTSKPEGRMVLTTLSMVAEMELIFIKERQRAGIAAAKARGVYKGRPRSIDRQQVLDQRADGQGATKIARQLGIGRATVYKILNETR